MSVLQDFTPTAIATLNGRMNIRQNPQAVELHVRFRGAACTFPVAVSMHVREQVRICEFSFSHSDSVHGYVFLRYDFEPQGNRFLTFRMNVFLSSSMVPLS
jgi:hypothetical protein